MFNKIVIIALSAALLVLSGCRSAPVYDVDDAEVVASTGQTSADSVRKAIVRAGGSLGWVMKNAGKGKLVGTLMLRKHVAIVDIDYSAKSYSIHYKDSQNLNYDGTNIHNNYNGWVQNLNRAIQSQLSML